MVINMSKKGLIKKAVASLAILAFGASFELGRNFLTPTSQEDMIEANLTQASKSPVPERFDSMTWQQAIKAVNTPDEAVDYVRWASAKSPLTHPFYNSKYVSNGYRTISLKKIHECKEAFDCSEAALAALALLSDNGYPPYMLCMEKLTSGHILPVCKINGKYRSLFSPEEFPSIDAIASKNGYSRYMLIDLNQQRQKDWISGDRNYFDFAAHIQAYLPYFSKK